MEGLALYGPTAVHLESSLCICLDDPFLRTLTMKVFVTGIMIMQKQLIMR